MHHRQTVRTVRHHHGIGRRIFRLSQNENRPSRSMGARTVRQPAHSRPPVAALTFTGEPFILPLGFCLVVSTTSLPMQPLLPFLLEIQSSKPAYPHPSSPLAHLTQQLTFRESEHKATVLHEHVKYNAYSVSEPVLDLGQLWTARMSQRNFFSPACRLHRGAAIRPDIRRMHKGRCCRD